MNKVRMLRIKSNSFILIPLVLLLIHTASCSVNWVPSYEARVVEQLDETISYTDMFYLKMYYDSTSQASLRKFENAVPYYTEIEGKVLDVVRMNNYRKKNEELKDLSNKALTEVRVSLDIHKFSVEFSSSEEVRLNHEQLITALIAMRSAEFSLPKK